VAAALDSGNECRNDIEVVVRFRPSASVTPVFIAGVRAIFDEGGFDP